MEQYLILASALAALITALASLFMVWEMRKQRLSSFHPNFAVIKPGFKGWINKDGEIQFTNDDQEPNKFFKFMGIKQLALLVVNVGLGAATEVKIQWDFDIFKFIKLIKQFDKKKIIEIAYQNPILKIRCEKEKLPSLYQFTFPIEELFPYILPASIDPKPFKFYLPIFYLSLWIALFKVRGLKLDNEVPPLILKINYKDIANNIMERNYSLNLHLYTSTQGKPSDDSLENCFDGIILVEENK